MPDITIADWSKLGSTIRARRQRLALSQTEAAHRANVSRSWLARVEAGHRGAELEQVMRLLDALGLTMVVRESPSGETLTSRSAGRSRIATESDRWPGRRPGPPALRAGGPDVAERLAVLL